MAEYIEQNESICRRCFHSYVCEQFNEHRNSDNQNCHFFNDHFVPAADVVKVTCRCKDCKHWMDFPNCGCTDFVKVCALAEYMIGQNGYCLYGERKENDS